MRKMFIAGAKCPECGQEDKIFVYQKDGEDIAECNACGYTSVRPKDVEPVLNSEQLVDGVLKIVK
ncbi:MULTISPECIES: YheV family putative zinc ribbon protein [unclassified Ketobacter]|uniref:YheV family putative zinc ribbon protein n=1 Tax=unclassified Ketobacter TaxID=2639109 RepID=UPI000F1BA293|nr:MULTISPECIES: YheV family putative zinc ribbon protein [unclassified Ketobacter]RLT87464.1 MAG: YheV family putative metal-binding protein [Ketobacter sp. GenoA1]RLT92855.1 MAG: YheV family putative metal-binding protein [Ketobacter sp.]